MTTIELSPALKALYQVASSSPPLRPMTTDEASNAKRMLTAIANGSRLETVEFNWLDEMIMYWNTAEPVNSPITIESFDWFEMCFGNK